MTIVALIPINTTIRHLMARCMESLAFSSAVIGFPGFPFDLPFAFLGGPLGGIFGCWGANCGSYRGLWQEALLLGLLESSPFGLSPFF